jgi:hypothetical protein
MKPFHKSLIGLTFIAAGLSGLYFDAKSVKPTLSGPSNTELKEIREKLATIHLQLAEMSGQHERHNVDSRFLRALDKLEIKMASDNEHQP